MKILARKIKKKKKSGGYIVTKLSGSFRNSGGGSLRRCKNSAGYCVQQACIRSSIFFFFRIYFRDFLSRRKFSISKKKEKRSPIALSSLSELQLKNFIRSLICQDTPVERGEQKGDV